MTDEAILDGQRQLWRLGDYRAVARHLFPISEDLVVSAGITGGQRVLDVAVGDGNAAVAASRAGASVVGVDLSPDQLDLARIRLADEGIDAELHEANAEALPFGDDSFDAVVSNMGVIFAPNQEAAAAEMARVCRPGGTVALTAWAGGGWSKRLWERAAHLLPPMPPGGPRPEVWGDPESAVGLLAGAGVEAEALRRDWFWQFESVADGAHFLRTFAGPFVALFGLVEPTGHGVELEQIMLDAMTEANVASDGSCQMPAPYLVVAGTR